MPSPTLEQLTGRRVVASDDANDVGSVKHAVLAPDGRRLTALHVAGRSRKPELVDWKDVTALGDDAVMIRSASSIRSARDETDEAFVRERIEPLGARVLDVDGFELGAVSDMAIDRESGRVEHAVVGDDVIPADRFRSIGTFALVVDRATTGRGTGDRAARDRPDHV